MVIDEDKLRMKFASLNVNFRSLSLCLPTRVSETVRPTPKEVVILPLLARLTLQEV